MNRSQLVCNRLDAFMRKNGPMGLSPSVGSFLLDHLEEQFREVEEHGRARAKARMMREFPDYQEEAV